MIHVQPRMDPAIIRAELAGTRPIRESHFVSGGNPTLREIEVLIALVEHSTNEQAAAALGMSVNTLKNRLTNVMERLGAYNRTHAVVLMWPVLKDYWPSA